MGDQIYVSREQTTGKEHLLSAINAAGKIAPQTVWDILKADPNPLLKDLLERSGGETTIVENDVVLFQGITLGGTGKETGKRHPTVRQGSIIGPGSKILGDIEIGQGAKIGSGSVVVKNVSPFTCVFGNPAQVVGQHTHLPGLTFDLSLPPIDYI